jgi:hypothetical protein
LLGLVLVLGLEYIGQKYSTKIVQAS